MKRTDKGLLMVVTALVLSICFSTPSYARVDVNLGINIPLPIFGFPEPPYMAPIPGSYVYFAPDMDVDIMFYRGFWYRPHEGRWYRANSYDGRWGYLPPRRVPRALIALPHDYRHIPVEHRKVSYGEMRGKWRKWEREKHWDRDDEWRGEEERIHEGRGRGHR